MRDAAWTSYLGAMTAASIVGAVGGAFAVVYAQLSGQHTVGYGPAIIGGSSGCAVGSIFATWFRTRFALSNIEGLRSVALILRFSLCLLVAAAALFAWTIALSLAVVIGIDSLYHLADRCGVECKAVPYWFLLHAAIAAFVTGLWPATQIGRAMWRKTES